jgi:hypothetical protein
MVVYDTHDHTPMMTSICAAVPLIAVTLALMYLHGQMVVKPSVAVVVPERVIVAMVIQLLFTPLNVSSSLEACTKIVPVTAPLVAVAIAWKEEYGLSLNNGTELVGTAVVV